MWMSFVAVLMQSLDVLLFAAYAAVAVRVCVRPAPRAVLRLLWLCVGAVVISAMFRAWGGFMFASLSGTSFGILVRYGSDAALKGALLSAALRLSGLRWPRAAAPLLASATSVALLASWLAWPSVGWGMAVTWITVAMWHVVCAAALFLGLRRGERAARGSYVCCSSCGYALTGLGAVERCPECGVEFNR